MRLRARAWEMIKWADGWMGRWEDERMVEGWKTEDGNGELEMEDGR
jgi:hypothetical protein